MDFDELPKIKKIICSGDKRHRNHSQREGEFCNLCGMPLIGVDQDCYILIKIDGTGIKEPFEISMDAFATEFIKEYLMSIFNGITDTLKNLDERVRNIEKDIASKFPVLNTKVEDDLNTFLETEKENNLPKKRNF